MRSTLKSQPVKSLRNYCGFTLVQILISLAILIILAVMSVPAMRSMISEVKVKGASENFAQQIELARSEALNKQENVYVSLATGDQWCSGVNASSACNCNTSGNCGVSVIGYNDYSGVSLTTAYGFTGGSISFDSIRAMPSESSQVTFQHEDKLIKVSINSAGKISYCSTNISGYTAC